MIHTTPPRIQQTFVAKHAPQSSPVIIDAFGKPAIAAKHEARIGKAMKASVPAWAKPKRHYKADKTGNETKMRKREELVAKVVEYCETPRTSYEVRDHFKIGESSSRKCLMTARRDGKIEQVRVGQSFLYQRIKA